MPISHLLTDSFYLGFGEVQAQENSGQSQEYAQLPGFYKDDRHHVKFQKADHVIFQNHRQPGDEHYARAQPHQEIMGYNGENDAFFECTDTGGSGVDLELYMEPAEIQVERSPQTNHSDFTPVLIDTDGGIYDAWALALALRSATSHSPCKLNIVGVTTVNGCTTVENTTRNVCKLVKHLGGNVPPVKIFKGMDSPLVSSPGSKTKRPSFFGLDGYGNLKDSPAVKDVKIQKDDAVTGIIKMAETYKGKLTILCLGPLTNLAMAVKLKPEITQYIKEIFIVGGNSEGMGNMTVTSEFNFFVDPEAANVVLESFNLCPVFVLPWETCMRSAALSQSFRMNALANLGTSEIELLNKLEQNFLSEHDTQWIVPEAVLMVIHKTEHYYCTVETQGKHTRGMMVVDKNFLGQHPANVHLITEMNRKIFGRMLIWAVGEIVEVEEKQLMGKEEKLNKGNIKIQSDYF